MRLGYYLVGRSMDDNAQLPILVSLMHLTEKRSFRLEVGASAERLPAEALAQRLGEFASGMHGLMLSGLLDVETLHALPRELERVVVLGRLLGASATATPDGSAKQAPDHSQAATRLLTTIAPDDQKAGATAVERLLRRGHRRIAFVAEEVIPNLHVAGLLAGYRLAHFDADVPLDPALLAISGRSRSGGGFAVDQLGKLDDPPTGFVLVDPRIAQGFLDEAQRQRRPVDHRDVVVIGMASELRLRGMREVPAVTTDAQMFSSIALQHLLHPPIDVDRSGVVDVRVPVQTLNFD